MKLIYTFSIWKNFRIVEMGFQWLEQADDKKSMLKNSSRKFGGVKDERRSWKVRRERPTPNEIARKRRERGREKRGEGTREHGWVVGGRKVKEGLERGDYAKSGCCLWLLRYRFPIPAFSALYILSTPIRVWYEDDAEAITGIPGDERCYYWGVAPLADVGSCEIQREREGENVETKFDVLVLWPG